MLPRIGARAFAGGKGISQQLSTGSSPHPIRIRPAKFRFATNHAELVVGPMQALFRWRFRNDYLEKAVTRFSLGCSIMGVLFLPEALMVWGIRGTRGRLYILATHEFDGLRQGSGIAEARTAAETPEQFDEFTQWQMKLPPGFGLRTRNEFLFMPAANVRAANIETSRGPRGLVSMIELVSFVNCASGI
jgi:hypothetical protein